MKSLPEIVRDNDIAAEESIQASLDRASRRYPATVLPTKNRLHVYADFDGVGGVLGEWHVWLNTESGDFDGLCIGIGPTRDAAVGQAVAVLEAATDELQKPPRQAGPR